MPQRKAETPIISATKDTVGESRIAAEFNLIRLLIMLNKLEEAKDRVEQLSSLAKTQGVPLSQEMIQRIYILKGLCLTRMGDHKGSATVWKKLSDANLVLDLTEAETHALSLEAPSPVLSTP